MRMRGAAALWTVAWLCLVTTPVGAVARQESAPLGSELRVWLVTMGPGDVFWESYGHNAIRILDTRTGRDASYNWGIFSFDQVGFIPRFLRGQMLYMVGAFQTQPMVDGYAAVNREVVLQELALTPAQKLELRTLVERNALPENAEYTYQYFLDNCSTRVRDVLDRVLGGRLRERFAGEPTGTTYRHHTRRLGQVDPLIYTGIDVLLGAPTDHELSVWEEMFIPMTLRDAIRGFEVDDGEGGSRPLVLSEEVAATSTRDTEPASPPRWLPIFLGLGMLLGASLAALATRPVSDSRWLRRVVLAMGVAWSLLGGALGTILILLLFTDHTFAFWNENLFLFSPLLLAMAVLIPLSGRSEAWLDRARRVAKLIVLVAIAGLVWQLAPWSRQDNGIFFAMALPAHIGLAWGLAASNSPASRPRSTDEA